MLRADYIPSNWILVWYLFYITGILRYNPKFALILGILFNVVTISAMIYYRVEIQNILYLVAFVFFLKGIPLWSLRNTKIQKKDIYATIGLFLMYVGWIVWEGQMMTVIQTLHGLIHNKIETHGMKMLQKLFG